MKKLLLSLGFTLFIDVYGYCNPIWSQRLMCVAVSGSKDDDIPTLVRRGADPNFQPSVGGCTPLHEAASYGNETEVRQLLTAGAEVNIRSLNNAWTALTFAKIRWKRDKKDAYTKIIQILEAAGGIE